MKKTLLIALFLIFYFAPYKCCAFRPNNVNFSGCTITNHQDIAGSLVIENGQLTSATVTGPADLKNSNILGHLEVAGKLLCSDSSIQSLTKTGYGQLSASTIKKKFSSTGKTVASGCFFGSYAGTGDLDFTDVQITETTENTGETFLKDSNLNTVEITGNTECKQTKCASLEVTGRTVLHGVEAQQTISIIGKTTGYNTACRVLSIVGKASLSDVTAEKASIVGDIAATKTHFESATITTRNTTFTDCTINTLYVQKNSSGASPVITIQNTIHAPIKGIGKIVCEDHTTKIVYGKNAIKTLEIIGTTNIIYK